MKNLGSVLWIFPAAVQIGYFLATYDELPPEIGAGPSGGGTEMNIFVVEWFAIIGLANAAFALLHVRLPHLGDRMLAVPGKEYWLATPERRALLVDRIRGICEASLLLLNVFFLAVYQRIYETNVATPVLKVPPLVLVPFFMALPVVAIVVVVVAALRSLAAEARAAGAHGADGRTETS